MQEYQKRRDLTQKRASAAGLVLAVAVHVCAFVFCSWSGLKYIWPPPEENTFVVDFEPTTEKDEIVRVEDAPAPPAKGEEQPEGNAPDPGVVSDGDVQTTAPSTDPKPDPRAVFPGMSKKDTATSAPVGRPESEILAPRSGNRAELSGRSVEGVMPKPRYNVQESGTVVVSIWVDNYGNVVKAMAGADGTTVTNSTLWAAARAAAMQTHFNMSADAPALQEGKITYIFNLK